MSLKNSLSLNPYACFWSVLILLFVPSNGLNYTVNSGHLIPDISLMLSPDFGSLKIEGLLAFDNPELVNDDETLSVNI